MDRDARTALLAAAGARGGEVEELLGYDENRFDLDAAARETPVPLPDEPFAECWSEWADQARERGAVAVLGAHLPQLRFPVREGISKSDAYRAATLRGVPADDLAEATGLELERPELVELELYASFAGRVPVLRIRGRQEFVALVRALAKRNEPAAVPEAQGAAMVSGLVNWERIRRLRRAWEERDGAERSTATWNDEFARIREHRELYQDRVVLLSDGPYSAVPAAGLGLDEADWREKSFLIRREHECCHYFTRRLLGSMQNRLLDELIADYTGLVVAWGSFQAGLFLRFLGLEEAEGLRPGGRLELYRGTPPLGDGAFRVLGKLVRAAAAHLERFDAARWEAGPRSLAERVLMIRVLASLSFLELAADDADERLERRFGALSAPAG